MDGRVDGSVDGSVIGDRDERFAAMVDDRPDEKLFRVDRAVYGDPDIFAAEMEILFERNWVYFCHESQVPEPGCYFAGEIGRQPVFVIRGEDGSLNGFINACAHRGAILTPVRQGRTGGLTCRFHGWAYDAAGNCISMKSAEPGADCAQFGLTKVARVESYRGFVFASLCADVPPLSDHLGAARAWIDLLVDQAPEGLEVVRGSSTYAIRGNWKLQIENAVDGYHVSTVHRVFARTVTARQTRDGTSGMARTEAGRIAGEVPSGSYDLGNGHMAIWATHTTPEVRPIWERKAQLERALSPEKVNWILTKGRNLSLFPNVMLMDNPSTQIRYMRPLSADRCEVTVWCIAPKGESRQARAARLRKFEDFYLTAGMATSDDIAALEDVHDGSRGQEARWNAFSRGYGAMVKGADAGARALGFEPVASSPNWDHEALYHGFYRRWRDLMAGKSTSTGAGARS